MKKYLFLLVALLVSVSAFLSATTVSAGENDYGEIFCSPTSLDPCHFLTDYKWQLLREMALHSENDSYFTYFWTRGGRTYKVSSVWYDQDENELFPIVPRKILFFGKTHTAIPDLGVSVQRDIVSYAPPNRLGDGDILAFTPQFEKEMRIPLKRALINKDWLFADIYALNRSFAGIPEDVYVIYYWELTYEGDDIYAINIYGYSVIVLEEVSGVPYWGRRYHLGYPQYDVTKPYEVYVFRPE